MSELQGRISEGEGQQLDFKFRIDDQKKIARTLSAFANTDGGSLLIGVKDSGKIAGCNPEEEFYMIEGAAQVFCKPAVPFESQVIQEGHHLVMEIVVLPSEQKHKAPDENGDLKFYHRLKDQTMLANKITFLLWRYKKEGKKKAESFTPELSKLLQLIEAHEPVSISKLFRESKLPKNLVNEHIATLVYWEVIEREVSKSGVKYKSL
ncbi:MAG: ATP-binding protein [Fluviicola sp. XM-24bin1]|nr:MAG: ATP-binding protein [Fluviicola sp. XM-24bin1]